MSANETSVKDLDESHRLYQFQSDIKIPSYLIALAVGNLEKVQLGNRVNLISEPSQVATAQKELGALPRYLEETEKYVKTPYAWGEYNVLVLPPSFPFGGMENPLLTFLSPTIITGDKSQIASALHEVAHSWTGNLVTCKTWQDFWLNEGLTVFIQRKVSEKIYGKERANDEAFIGSFSLHTAIDNDQTSGLTQLHQDMGDRLPDAAKT